MTRVIHFEMPVDNPERAIKFYGNVFGWQFNKWEGPTEYWLVKTGKDGEPGIDGGLMRRGEQLPSTRNVISVTSVDDYVAKIKSAGGKVPMPKTEIPGIGFFALCQDTEGNVFGIMQNA